MELAEELGAVGGLPAPTDTPKRPKEPTTAERRYRERRDAKHQAFAEKMRPHVEPLVAAGYSYRQMARALNEAGLKNSLGDAWHPESIRCHLLPRLGLRR
jgi:hypothetical protein